MLPSERSLAEELDESRSPLPRSLNRPTEEAPAAAVDGELPSDRSVPVEFDPSRRFAAPARLLADAGAPELAGRAAGGAGELPSDKSLPVELAESRLAALPWRRALPPVGADAPEAATPTPPDGLLDWASAASPMHKAAVTDSETRVLIVMGFPLR